MKTQFVLSIFLCLLLSCEEEISPSINVDPELKPYVDAFFEEAGKRGIYFDQGLDAILQKGMTVCGQGHSPDFNGMFEKPTILISDVCWPQYNEIAREILIFHELGHALLNRLHIEGKLQNGNAKSIMCAGNGFDCS
ncbi:MAG: hypothetical protein AAF696_28495, partial [Bacteroidota bacterium]